MDSEGNPYEATNEGYWGPSSGFAIGAEYNKTTPWTVTFSEAGEYNVTVSLIDAATEEVVADITETFTVDVQAEGGPAEYHTYKFNIEALPMNTL